MLLDHSLDDVLLDSSPYVFHIKDLRLCRLVIKPLNIIRTSSATWCQSFYSHFIGNLEWSYNVFILCWLHHWGIIFKKSTHVYTSCLWTHFTLNSIYHIHKSQASTKSILCCITQSSSSTSRMPLCIISEPKLSVPAEWCGLYYFFVDNSITLLMPPRFLGDCKPLCNLLS